jgi:hypothetical protein
MRSFYLHEASWARLEGPETAAVLGVQSRTSDKKLGPHEWIERSRRRTDLLALNAQLAYSRNCARTTKQESRLTRRNLGTSLFPGECACQGESKNSSVQNERQDSEICETKNKNVAAAGLGG